MQSKIRILQYPNELLKTACIEAEDKSRNSFVATELYAAMKSSDQRRVPLGLSANQIGITDARVFVVDGAYLKLKHYLFINPSITAKSLEVDILDESCMSFPDSVSVPIRRYRSISVEFIDSAWNKRIEAYTGLAAQVMQHEIDHLNGITLFQNSTPKMQKQILRKIEQARSRRQ